ncbi:MAG: DUF1150 family protein [Rhodospirillaceae bacterium]
MSNSDIKQDATAAEQALAPHKAIDMAAIGLNVIAYAKQGEAQWTIHAANGEQIGTANSRDLARAVITQHDMTPLSVH